MHDKNESFVETNRDKEAAKWASSPAGAHLSAVLIE